MVNKELKLKNIIFKETSLDISRRQLSIFLKEYNDWKYPLSEIYIKVLKEPQKFIEFIFKRTDIPISKEKKNNI